MSVTYRPEYKKEGIFSLGDFILYIISCSSPNGQPQPQMILPPTAPMAPRESQGIQRKMIHSVGGEKLQYAEGTGKNCGGARVAVKAGTV